MGMYDIIKSKILCPVCGIITPMVGQTKAFDGVLGIYDVNNLPFDRLFIYNPELKKECISRHYDITIPSFRKVWHLEFPAIMECVSCGTMMDVEFSFISNTYTRRKPTNDWVLNYIGVNSVWPDTMPKIKRQFGTIINYMDSKGCE